MRFRSMYIYISVLASHGGISLTLYIVTKPTDSSNSYQNCLSSAVTIYIALHPSPAPPFGCSLGRFEIFHILFRFVLLIASPFSPRLSLPFHVLSPYFASSPRFVASLRGVSLHVAPHAPLFRLVASFACVASSSLPFLTLAALAAVTLGLDSSFTRLRLGLERPRFWGGAWPTADNPASGGP